MQKEGPVTCLLAKSAKRVHRARGERTATSRTCEELVKSSRGETLYQWATRNLPGHRKHGPGQVPGGKVYVVHE